MKKILSLSIVILQFFLTNAQPSGYYDETAGLSGDDLRFALRSIIKSGHQKNNYGDLYYYYESTDNFGSNKVWDMYSMDENGNANYYFYFNGNDECGGYHGEGDCYNREHSVPQSWMGAGKSYARADLFVVIPSDGYVNGRRSNHPYGENNGSSFTSTNGSKVRNCTYSGYSGKCFEPIDCFKGDFARAYFYVVTRYNVSDWGGASFQGDGFSDWTLQMLLEWHYADPVSQKEIDKNNAVYEIQHNRNPYIDHPEWVASVFDENGAVEPADNLVAQGISSSEIDISWNLNSNNENVILAYSTDNVFGTPNGSYSVGNTIAGGGTIIYKGNQEQFTHTGVSAQTYYYKIWSYRDENYSNGITTQATPLVAEPTEDPTNFIVSSTSTATINLTWTDAAGSIPPNGYLIKMSKNAENIEAPSDGTEYPNSNFAKNIAQGVQSATFSNLTPNTEYFFKIYPYSNSGSSIDYKTDNPQEANGTTTEGEDLSNLFISEIATSGYDHNYQNEYIELTNSGNTDIDLTNVELEYYEGTSLIANLNLTGIISSNSAYLISVRTNYSGPTPDFIPPTPFSLNKDCHLLLKTNETTIDLAGNETDQFIHGNNYEFINFSLDNEPVNNWKNLGNENGSPGILNSTISIPEKITHRIKVSPNPNNGLFTIISDENNIQQIEIQDITGKIIYKNKNYSPQKYIDISNVQSGIYIIKIQTKDNILWNKFIKK